MTRPLLALGLAFVLAGCSPLRAVNALVPDDTFRLVADQAYGEHPRQRLDVYLPATAVRDAPVVVFFYGGSWTSGERAAYRFVGESFAARGIVTVIPDYRLHPEVRYPAFLEDGADALRWVREKVAALGGDPDRIVLAGHSAGAYNAAMLAYAPGWLARAGLPRDALRGFVGLAGPYDFLPLTGATTRAVFGWPDTSPDTQPITHLQAGAAPALLLVAEGDRLVSPGNSERLAARLQALGTPATVLRYDRLSHVTLVGALAEPLRRVSDRFGGVIDPVVRFVQAPPQAPAPTAER